VRRALAVIALSVAAAGCASAPPAPMRGELIRTILASTVQLRVEREGGGRRAASGIAVASDRAARRAWIATARHFVDPPLRQELFVRRPGTSTSVKGSIVFVSPDVDLAIIEIQGLDLPPARFKETSSLGDEILVIAFPWGRRFTVVSGVVSQIAAREGEAPVEGPARMVDSSVSYGSSGGGVFDAHSGALIGMVEGYRTARISIPEARDKVLEVPVAGETTVIAASTIMRFLAASGLADFLQK
jgi:S1-C subfamily serine protease